MDQVSPGIQQLVIPSPHDQVMEKHKNINNYKFYGLFAEARGPLHATWKDKGRASLCICQC